MSTCTAQGSHSRLLFELQQEYYQHLLPTTSLRINNEQRRFSSFDAFSLLFYFFILCVCVCTCIENNKMMILMTFRLLFCCNRTSCLFLSLSLPIYFIFVCFIFIDALPCVYVCGCIMHSLIFPIFYALSLSLSLLVFLIILYDRRRRSTKREKELWIFFLFCICIFVLFFFCSLCTQQTHIHTHNYRTIFSFYFS